MKIIAAARKIILKVKYSWNFQFCETSVICIALSCKPAKIKSGPMIAKPKVYIPKSSGEQNLVITDSCIHCEKAKNECPINIHEMLCLMLLAEILLQFYKEREICYRTIFL